MINNEAVQSRRNFPSAFETAKKVEQKKYVTDHIPDQIYGLYIFDDCLYVGITNNPTRRWSDHQKGIADPLNFKDAYITIREHPNCKDCRMVILDPIAEFTEAEWVVILSEQGHQLSNVAGAVDSKRKKKVAEVAKALAPKHSDKFKKLMTKPTSLTFVKAK